MIPRLFHMDLVSVLVNVFWWLGAFFLLGVVAVLVGKGLRVLGDDGGPIVVRREQR